MTNQPDVIQAKIELKRRAAEMLAKEIADLERQLKEAEGPKLRHGDYGRNIADAAWIILGDWLYWLVDGKRSDITAAQVIEPGEVNGNLADELAALGKDRTKAELSDFTITLRPNNRDFPVQIERATLMNAYTLDRAEEIARAILQIVATAKRSEGK
jgi:hypothetical protein